MLSALHVKDQENSRSHGILSVPAAPELANFKGGPVPAATEQDTDMKTLAARPAEDQDTSMLIVLHAEAKVPLSARKNSIALLLCLALSVKVPVQS